MVTDPGIILCFFNKSGKYLLLVLFLLTYTIIGYGQSSYFQLHTSAGQKVKDIIHELEVAYQIQFSYPSSVGDFPVNGNGQTEAESLNDLLSQFFDQQNIEFKQTASKTILLRAAPTKESPSYPIQGIIMDSESGLPLENATVQITPDGYGVYTDANGSFFIALKEQAVPSDTIIIKSLGFAERRIPISELNSNQRIVLEPYALPLKEILIIEPLARRSPTSVYSMLNTTARKRKLAGGTSQLMGRDVFRQLQLLPGIFSANDQSAALQIRGSADSETYIMLDGIPLYHSDHYYGIFSAIQSDWVDGITVYQNNMPIPYDGRTGGMVQLESIDSLGKPVLGIDLNTLTGAVQVGSPIIEGIDFQLGYRSTWQSVTDAPFFSQQATTTAFSELIDEANTRQALLTLQPNFTFSDVHGRIGINKRKHQAKISFYSSTDIFDNDYVINFRNRTEQGFLENEESFKQSIDWRTQGVSISYAYSIHHDLYIIAEGYLSGHKQDALLTGSLKQSLIRRGIPVRSLQFENNRFNNLEETGGRVMIKNNAGLTAGISLTRPNVESIIHQDDRTILSNRGAGTISAAYAEKEWKNNNLTLSLGGRLSYFDVDQQLRLAPRLHAYWQMDPSWMLKSAVGRHFQYVRELTYENRLGESIPFWVLADNNDFPVGHSWNAMIGVKWQKGSWGFDMELYHKKPEGVVEYAAVRPGFQEANTFPGSMTNFRAFRGEGRIWGMDVLATYQRRNWSSQFAYTLSKHDQQFDGVAKNSWFAASDDRRHQLSWSTDYTVGKWTFSTSYLFNSGRPYTDVSLLNNNQDRTKILPSDRQARLPAYHRLDIGFERSIQIGNGIGSLGLSIFNLTDRENVAYRQYILSIPVQRKGQIRNEVMGTQSGLLPRTFSINARWLLH